MNIHPYATAKVRYEEFDGNVELSTTYAAESTIEFMKWIVAATDHYQAKLKYDREYRFVERFIIDYRMNNETGSLLVTRVSVGEFTSVTYGA